MAMSVGDVVSDVDVDVHWLVTSVLHQMGLVMTKTVFGVSHKVRFKSACSATD